mgnify:CR=1 FL=1
MTINLKKYDEHVFVVDIDVTRFEHFTYGNSVVGVKANALRYVEEIIKAKPTDLVEGLVQPSLTAWADYCDIVYCDVSCIDECEGVDPDRDIDFLRDAGGFDHAGGSGVDGGDHGGGLGVVDGLERRGLLSVVGEDVLIVVGNERLLLGGRGLGAWCEQGLHPW